MKRPSLSAAKPGRRAPVSNAWTSAVMNMVLPERLSPVTPRRRVGVKGVTAASARLLSAMPISSLILVGGFGTRGFPNVAKKLGARGAIASGPARAYACRRRERANVPASRGAWPDRTLPWRAGLARALVADAPGQPGA